MRPSAKDRAAALAKDKAPLGGEFAEEWGAALAEQGAEKDNGMAAEWASMIDEGVEDDRRTSPAPTAS